LAKNRNIIFIMSSVKDFYTNSALYEWQRLSKDNYHSLEFLTTFRSLKEYLPSKGHIIDAGGGPGRYTIELAKLGYDVTLLDYTPALLEKAKREIGRAKVKNKVKQIAEGSITDLSRFWDNSFDAVLCLGGPMSHLKGAKNRRKAASELVRIVKPGGLIFVSVIGRLSIMIDICLRWPEEIDMTDHFREIWRNGEDNHFHQNSYAHHYLPEELEALFKDEHVEILNRIGLEGLAHVPKQTNALARKFNNAWTNWLEAHWHYCNHPSVYATSGHMLLIMRKNKTTDGEF